jgi:biotin operon repressor/DNA-binding transcriptional regulator YhcF (GntR family)
MEETKERKGFVKMENNRTYMIDEKSGRQIKSEVDIAVYAVIKSFANYDSNECFPSITTISSRLGLSDVTISKSIKKLQSLGELIVWKEKRKNYYRFPKEKDNWKKINYAFLDLSPDKLSAMEKGLMIMLRQYFYENTNEINLSIRGLAQRLGIPHRTFNDRIQELMKKGLVTKGELKIETHQANRFSLQFNMKELKLELDKVNEKVDKIEAKVESNNKQAMNLIENLQKQIDELKKATKQYEN